MTTPRLVLVVATVAVGLGCSSTVTAPAPAGDGGAVLASGEVTPDASAPDAAPPACLVAGDDCAANISACCNGEICVHTLANPSALVCAVSCLDGNQCNTGCCTKLVDGTAAVCAPATFCAPACVTAGGACSPSGGHCCASAVCVTSATNSGSCADTCVANSDCVSLCCAPLNNSAVRVCSEPHFCQ